MGYPAIIFDCSSSAHILNTFSPSSHGRPEILDTDLPCIVPGSATSFHEGSLSLSFGHWFDQNPGSIKGYEKGLAFLPF